MLINEGCALVKYEDSILVKIKQYVDRGLRQYVSKMCKHFLRENKDNTLVRGESRQLVKRFEILR